MLVLADFMNLAEVSILILTIHQVGSSLYPLDDTTDQAGLRTCMAMTWVKKTLGPIMMGPSTVHAILA